MNSSIALSVKLAYERFAYFYSRITLSCRLRRRTRNRGDLAAGSPPTPRNSDVWVAILATASMPASLQLCGEERRSWQHSVGSRTAYQHAFCEKSSSACLESPATYVLMSSGAWKICWILCGAELVGGQISGRHSTGQVKMRAATRRRLFARWVQVRARVFRSLTVFQIRNAFFSFLLLRGSAYIDKA